MDEINKALSKRVKSGEYFSDAKEWYFRRLISPIIERSYLGFIAVASIICITTISFNIYNLYPIISKPPVIIKIDDSLNKVGILTSIGRSNLTPGDSVRDYLIRRYVTNIESYNFDNIQNQLNVINNSSLKSIYKNFANYLSLNNPNSPIFYQKQKKRTIDISSVNFLDKENCIVRYEATEDNFFDKTVTKNKYIAEISFQMEDLSDIIKQEDNKSLNFIVTEYNTEQISK